MKVYHLLTRGCICSIKKTYLLSCMIRALNDYIVQMDLLKSFLIIRLWIWSQVLRRKEKWTFVLYLVCKGAGCYCIRFCVWEYRVQGRKREDYIVLWQSSRWGSFLMVFAKGRKVTVWTKAIFSFLLMQSQNMLVKFYHWSIYIFVLLFKRRKNKNNGILSYDVKKTGIYYVLAISYLYFPVFRC